jgi:hypothetical protein
LYLLATFFKNYAKLLYLLATLSKIMQNFCIFWPLFQKLRQNFIQISGHTDPGASAPKLFTVVVKTHNRVET